MSSSEPPPAGLVDLTRRLGGLAWVSDQLFGIEGRWAESMNDPAGVVHLGTYSRHHGWHATLWRGALPDSPALDAAEAIGPPTTGWARAVALADTFDDEHAGRRDAARLAFLYRGVVPRTRSLVADLDDRLEGLGVGHLARVVRLVSPDLDADAQRGHRLLEVTLRSAEGVETASSVTRVLDEAFRT